MSGYRDVIENAAKSYKRHPEYTSADRAYNQDYGKLEDYRDGYKQGFEKGYEAGYGKQKFESAIPESLAYRGDVNVEPVVDTPAVLDVPIPDVPADDVADAVIPDDEPIIDDEPLPAADQPQDDPYTDRAPAADSAMPKMTKASLPNKSAYTGDEIIIIPADTELVVELLEEMDTKVLREGDPFKARVVSPSEIGGAIIEGRVAKNRKPGRLKRRAELVLSFDRIVLSQNRWANFNAFIIEVLPLKGDNVKRVDNEGTVEGQRPYKEDSIKLGAATGSGLIIGAIVGGPVGAAVGAGVGAAFGVGAVVVERGKYIQLAEQQQLRIKTAYETQIR
ncbi:MAG: hypothetical protein J5I65_12155 [Aridibacter famidurans]|nr:hypothetical protein [Aridibacter famidurans]